MDIVHWYLLKQKALSNGRAFVISKVFFLFLLMILLPFSVSPAWGIQLSLPDTFATTGSELVLPMNLTELGSKAPFGFQLQIVYDKGRLTAVGVENKGTLSEGFMMAVNTTRFPGMIIIAAASESQITRPGILLRLQFQVLPSAPLGTTSINFTEVNLGSDVGPVSYRNGKVKILPVYLKMQPLPTITIAENTNDRSLILNDFVSTADSQRAQLKWSYTGNQHIAVIIDTITSRVTLTPSVGWYGEEQIIFTGNYYGTASVSDTAHIIVLPNIRFGQTADTTLSSDTCKIPFLFADGSSLSVQFWKGNAKGSRLAITPVGTSLTGTFPKIDTLVRAIGYYSIISTIHGDFSAHISFQYTDAQLVSAGINEPLLTLAYYDSNAFSWKPYMTLLDTISNTASADVTHFSLWSLTDSTSLLILSQTSVPAELESFSAHINNFNNIQIVWTIANGSNNAGFVLQYSKDGTFFSQIAFVPCYSITTQTMRYTFVHHVDYPGEYFYRLKKISLDGTYTYSEILDVRIGNPQEYNLFQNYPNPFNSETVIHYKIPKMSRVHMVIYNILGQFVRTLVDGDKPGGDFTIVWNGKDENGNEVAPGVYFYRFEAGEFSSTRKMLLLK